MPLTQLDDVTALVLIDLQNGIVGMESGSTEDVLRLLNVR